MQTLQQMSNSYCWDSINGNPKKDEKNRNKHKFITGFAIELVTFAVEFVDFAVEFVMLALQFVALAIELDAFAVGLCTFALELVAFALEFVIARLTSWSKHENKT